jgi:hypothetical protein
MVQRMRWAGLVILVACGSTNQGAWEESPPPAHIQRIEAEAMDVAPEPTMEPEREGCSLAMCEGVATQNEPADPRLLQPKPRTLLVAELNALEQLLASTPKNASDRPRLLLRIAHSYAELALAAEQEQPQQHNSAKIAAAAHANAAKRFAQLVSEYPRWCSNESAPPEARHCADEAGYYAGLELERMKQFEQACLRYAEVVAQPESIHRARACDAMRRVATGF